jgi:hypothetical protein
MDSQSFASSSSSSSSSSSELPNANPSQNTVPQSQHDALTAVLANFGASLESKLEAKFNTMATTVAQQVQGLKQDRRAIDLKRPYQDVARAREASRLAAVIYAMEAGGPTAVDFLVQLFQDGVRQLDDGAEPTSVDQAWEKAIIARFQKPLAEGVLDALRSSTTTTTGSANPAKRKKGWVDCSHCGKSSHQIDSCWKLHPELIPGRSQLQPLAQPAPQLYSAPPQYPASTTNLQQQYPFPVPTYPFPYGGYGVSGGQTEASTTPTNTTVTNGDPASGQPMYMSSRPVCRYCGANTHRSEGCWKQFPHLRPKKNEQKQ